MKVKHTLGEILEAPVYWSFWTYLRVLHDVYYYSWVYLKGKKNIPPKGTPMIIASNHQNGMNDPLGIVFAFGDRIVSIFTRASAFNNKNTRRFLSKLFLLPAYRLKQDGEESLEKNYDSFSKASERLLGGNAIAIFPEGINQTGHWLGEFSSAYLRMAFKAAENSGFETDIVILPICNHYTNYFRMRERMMIKCGEPVHLKPYYELYKTKPRTVQREVNHLVRGRIEEMMLNITDLDHYDAIDYLRNSRYGRHYAQSMGLNPDYLPDKLTSDKDLVAKLDLALKANPARMESIYKGIIQLQYVTHRLQIRDWNFEKPYSLWRSVWKGIVLSLLLPVFILSLIPNILVYYTPYPFTRKIRKRTDNTRMMVGAVQFAMTALYSWPIIYGVTFVLEGLYISWILAAVHLFLMPYFGLFAWYYRKHFIKWRSEIWYNAMETARYRKLRKTKELRNNIFSSLDELLERKNRI